MTTVNLATLLPEPVRDGLRTLRRVVPQPVVSLAERAVARSTDQLSGVTGRPQPPRTQHRLWVGPVNYAGQGHQWARAIENHSAHVGARSMAVVRSLRFPVDYEVSPRAYGFIDWQRAQERYVTRNYTHVLIEAERPLFGTLYGGTCERELPRLRRAGLRPALICHGSDVRLPSRHASRFPFSPFADAADPLTSRLQRQALRNLSILSSVEEPVFVSTPDLLDDVPQARWCPVVVEPDVWATDRPVLERDRPVVVHIPTSGPLKGSGLVDPVLRELDEQGHLEYRSLRGLTHAEVRQAYQDADIVLDQFVLGLYGVSAAEAMAAGRVVVAYVTDPVRRRVAEATGLDVPILEAGPSTVREVVLRVIHDRQEGQRIAAQGPAFVRAVHDGRHSARVLSAIFDEPRP